jgi:hypothetical protein
MAGGDKLTARQRRAVVALLNTRTVEEAARLAGVSVRSMYRWQRDPGFCAAVRDHARDSAREATSRLLAVQRRAVTALVAALDDESPSLRLRAAVALLEHGRHAVGDDVDERLAALEARVSVGRWPGWHGSNNGDGSTTWSPGATVSR